MAIVWAVVALIAIVVLVPLVGLFGRYRRHVARPPDNLIVLPITVDDDDSDWAA